MLTVAHLSVAALRALLEPLGLKLALVADGAAIPGTYWGEPEAGLIAATVYLRADTPLHSVLHEAAHVLCMDDPRRAVLSRDAGGDHAEEDAVCYLQIELAARLPGAGRERLCADMDAWGYTFRLGSAARWYAEDAAEARAFLEARGLLGRLPPALQELTWNNTDSVNPPGSR